MGMARARVTTKRARTPTRPAVLRARPRAHPVSGISATASPCRFVILTIRLEPAQAR